jgi:transcriptional regulator with XRE-family HTH domain
VKYPLLVKAFGERVRELRLQKKLSQEALAEKSDIAPNTVQRVENARISASINLIFALAKGLGLPLHKLMDFKIPEESKSNKPEKT